MRFSSIFLAAVFAIGCTRFIAAADAKASCPDSIEVRQELSTSLDGWTPTHDETPHRLAGITFYDGPPQERVSLVNDRTIKSAGRETAIWRFKPQANRQIFMACSYAATTILLTKALPPETGSCAVTYKMQVRIAGLPAIEKIVCK